VKIRSDKSIIFSKKSTSSRDGGNNNGLGVDTNREQCALDGDYANVSRWKVLGRLVNSIDREGKSQNKGGEPPKENA
jgi:hypothetical protein